MGTDAQRQTLLNAVSLLRAAEQLLVQAGRDTSDPTTLMKITNEYNQLDSYLSQLLHAQAIADDAAFASATAALKQQASTLQTEEDDIKKIVADVGTAAQIVGYIAQALSFVATL